MVINMLARECKALLSETLKNVGSVYYVIRLTKFEEELYKLHSLLSTESIFHSLIIDIEEKLK